MTGKAPVWSEKMVLVGLKKMNALFVFCWGFGGGRGASVMRVGLVFGIVGEGGPGQC